MYCSNEFTALVFAYMFTPFAYSYMKFKFLKGSRKLYSYKFDQ